MKRYLHEERYTTRYMQGKCNNIPRAKLSAENYMEINHSTSPKNINEYKRGLLKITSENKLETKVDALSFKASMLTQVYCTVITLIYLSNFFTDEYVIEKYMF